MPLPFLKLIDTPPVWLAVFVAAAYAQSRLIPLVPAGTSLRWAGAILILAALILFAAASAEFRRRRTTIIPHLDPTTLIDGGVYRLTRNPIYLADAMILAGFALRWDAVSLILVPVFVWLITRRFILGEEARLRATFGQQFDAYAARVRRWL